MKKVRPVTKAMLAGHQIEQETCLLSLGDDGTLYLNHVQAEVMDKETGVCLGSLVLNDEVRLSLSRFEFWPIGSG